MKQKMKYVTKGKSTLKKGVIPKKNITDYRKPHAFDNATGAYKKKNSSSPPNKSHRNKYIAGVGVAATGYAAKKTYDKHKENKSVKGRLRKVLGR